MTDCPICDSKMTTHASFGVTKTNGCRTCRDLVCPECFYGMRYTCKIFEVEKEKEECSYCKDLDYRYFMYKTVYDSTEMFLCSGCAEVLLTR